MAPFGGPVVPEVKMISPPSLGSREWSLEMTICLRPIGGKLNAEEMSSEKNRGSELALMASASSLLLRDREETATTAEDREVRTKYEASLTGIATATTVSTTQTNFVNL